MHGFKCARCPQFISCSAAYIRPAADPETRGCEDMNKTWPFLQSAAVGLITLHTWEETSGSCEGREFKWSDHRLTDKAEGCFFWGGSVPACLHSVCSSTVPSTAQRGHHGQKVCCVSQHSVSVQRAWRRYHETGQGTRSGDAGRRRTTAQQQGLLPAFVCKEEKENHRHSATNLSSAGNSGHVSVSLQELKPSFNKRTNQHWVSLSWNICSIRWK